MSVGDKHTSNESDGRIFNAISTTEEWEAVNPVLGNGELGIEVKTDSTNLKIGDGTKQWNELPYFISELISKALEKYSTCPYDVGDILQTTNATDPAERWPGTTWEVFAPGRVLIGAGTGTDSRNESKTFTVGQTGGEYNHVLTTGELPSHKHSYYGWPCMSTNTDGSAAGAGARGKFLVARSSADAGNKTEATLENHMINTGSNESHNIMQSYQCIYIYRRTA